MIEDPTLLRIRTRFPRPTAAQVAKFRDVPTGFVCDAMDGRGGMETAISPLGVTEEKIPQLAEEAAAQWTAQFNPVAVTADDLAGVYRGAL